MNIVESLFGRSKTPAERLRAHQRALQKAQRELDRERSKLEVQEKKLVADIKKSAKEGQMNACKIQAKDLVRTRRNVQKFYQMRTQLQAVSLRIQTLRSTTQMGEAMKGATKAMGTMNRTLNLPAVSKIMRDFERESEVMDMKEEMMGEAVDGAMEDDEELGEDEESDNILKEVLDEIGVGLGQQLGNAPTASLNAPTTEPSERIAIGESAIGGSGGGGSGGRAGGAGTKGSAGPLSGAGAGGGGAGAGAGAGKSDEDALQARLDSLRKD